MKYLLFLFCLVFATAHADTRIAEACHNQAKAFLSALQSEVFSDMSETQSQRVFTLAMTTCEQEFSRVEKADLDNGEQDRSNDWFTNYILRGEQPDKAGNKRLKRMNRR